MLHQCHPDLIKLFLEVAIHTNIKILCGKRGQEEQTRMFEMGRSKVEWPNSLHNAHPTVGPRRVSHAVDVSPDPIPFKWGQDWKDRVKFYEIAAVVRYEARRMNLSIRWGGDWDGDGDYKDQTFDDLLHFEIH
jgi:peptidoglycan L-alanyl-D-glutamate endopeptidase CwlK